MTIREIAAAAGVSPATVSFVLNSKPGVRKELRAKITEILLENGYTIRQAAQSSGNIKLLRYKGANHQPERYEEFVSGIMEGIETGARAQGYSLSITTVTDETFSGLSQLIADEHVDGVVFVASEFDAARYREVLALPVPTVSVDNYFQNYPVPAVNTNNILGTHAAIEYLYQLGHRKIGFLKSSFAIGGILPRSRGIREAMARFDLSLDPSHVFEFDMLFDQVYTQMCAYLDDSIDLPTAFIADSDIIAAACQRALQTHGIHVPEDVSIIGFDDLRISSMVNPPLTTMRVHRHRMGVLAVEQLIHYLREKDDVVLKVSVSPTLIERGTTAAPPC